MAPLAIGAVHPQVIVAVCLALVVSAALAVVSAGGGRLELGPAFLLLAGLAAVTAIQLVPFPPSLHAVLSEPSHAVWTGAFATAGRSPEWAPLTVAPVLTSIELLELLALVTVFVLGVLWVREDGHRPLLTTIALVGLACALVAIVHRLLGLEEVYGLYAPRETRGAWHSAPLLNTNHLAGLMVLCTPIAIGLGLDLEDRSRRALWFVAAGVMGMVAVLSLSRGGIAALVLALGLLAILVIRAGARGTAESEHSALWLVIGVLGAVAGGAYVAFEAVIEEYLQGDNTSKAAIWAAAWPMLMAYLPFGVGRGAFTDVFAAYDDELGARVIYTHPENLVVQWIADWGVIGALGAAALVVGIVLVLVRGSRRAAKVGAMAGAAALVAHNLVDFSLEILGVSLVFVAAVAVLFHGHGRRRVRFRLRLDAWVAAAAAAIALLAAGGSAIAAQRDLWGGQLDQLRQSAAAEAPSFDEELARDAVLERPASFMVPYLAGAAELRSGAGTGLRWFERALELDPDYGLSHLWIARSLAAAGRDPQSLLEYRMAARLDPGLVRTVARETAARWPRAERLRAVLAGEPPQLELGDRVIAELTRAGHEVEARELNAAVLERVPEYPPALERAARDALRAEDYDRARELAARISEDDVRFPLVMADVESGRGEAEAASQRIAAAISAYPAEEARLLGALTRHRERAGDLDGVREAYDQLEAATGRAGLDRVLVARGRFEERAGRDAIALRHFQRAATLGAGRPALEGIARVAERRGEIARALSALRRISRLGGGDAKALSSRTKALEQRAERRRLERLLQGGQ